MASAPAPAPAGAIAFDLSDSGEEPLEGGGESTPQVLFTLSAGGFFQSAVNLAKVKVLVADLVGLGACDGGVDFCSVDLPYVESTETRPAWVMRPLSTEGETVLAGWCSGGPRSCPIPGVSFSEGGVSTPVDIVVDSAPLTTEEGGGWSTRDLVSAAALLPCASRLGLGAYTGNKLLLSLFFESLEQLQLASPKAGHLRDRRVQEVILMKDPRGMEAQAAEAGYSVRLLRVEDETSPYHTFGLRPKAAAGGARANFTQGCTAQLEFTPLEATNKPPAILLRARVPWLVVGSFVRATAASPGDSYDAASNDVTTFQVWTEGYAAARTRGADGEVFIAIAPTGVDPCSLAEGLVLCAAPRAARPRRSAVDMVKYTLMVADASRARAPFYAVPCATQQVRAARMAFRGRRTEGGSAKVVAAIYDDALGESCRKSVCRGGQQGCAEAKWPCNVAAVYFRAEEHKALEASAGGRVRVANPTFEPGLGGTLGAGRGAGAGGRRLQPGGGGRGGPARGKGPGGGPAAPASGPGKGGKGKRDEGGGGGSRGQAARGGEGGGRGKGGGRGQGAEGGERAGGGEVAKGVSGAGGGEGVLGGCTTHPAAVAEAAGGEPMDEDAELGEGDEARAACEGGWGGEGGEGGKGGEDGEGAGGGKGKDADVGMADGLDNGGDESGAGEAALSAAGFAQVRARLRALVQQGFRHMGWNEAKAVCEMLFQVVRSDRSIVHSENAVFEGCVMTALETIRSEPEGIAREVDNLAHGPYVTVIRPLFRNEPAPTSGVKRMRREDGADSESDADGEPRPGTGQCDSAWDAVMEVLQRSQMVTAEGGGFSEASIFKAARDAKADMLVMDAEKAAVMVVRGLKILEKLELCTTKAGEENETMFVLSLKAFGDCRHGAPGRGDSTVLDPVA